MRNNTPPSRFGLVVAAGLTLTSLADPFITGNPVMPDSLKNLDTRQF